MSVQYQCPNPACGVTLRSPKPIPAGKSIVCPKCRRSFTPSATPEPATEPAAAGGILRFADEDPPPQAGTRPTRAAPATASPVASPKKTEAPASPRSRFADDDDSDSAPQAYAVIKESEEEKEEAAKNKHDFLAVRDKFKRSARGPAQSLLVMPSKLLIAEGLITVIAAIVIFITGMWPLVFNDAPPGEEELEEAIMQMLVGVVVFFWGAMVCFGASQMQEVASYPWAMVGAVMGVLPFLVGIYAIIMLQNEKVKAGFAESEGGPDDDEDEDEDEDEDD